MNKKKAQTKEIKNKREGKKLNENVCIVIEISRKVIQKIDKKMKHKLES